MRMVNAKDIQKTVEELCIKANIELRPDLLAGLKRARRAEHSAMAKKILSAILKNAEVAKMGKLAICQDTGMISVYIDIGENVKILGGGLEQRVNSGVAKAYKKASFRKSVVGDPFIRKNTKDNAPSILHIRFVSGNKVKITVSPKGFGSENKSRTKMFAPTAPMNEVKKFIIDTVTDAGPDACPPFVVGIGIGGTLDKAAQLAKEALLRPINKRNPKPHLARLEREILSEINRSGIGPMGLGGKTTALSVNILSYPTHIAGLPVAVNISCHATRSASRII